MFQNGKKREKKSEDCSFPSRVWGKMIEKWRKTSGFYLVLFFFCFVCISQSSFSCLAVIDSRYVSRFAILFYQQNDECLPEYVRGRESDIIEVLLDCDAYFSPLLCDIRPRNVQVFLSNARGIRRKENKTRKMAHWQLTIIDFFVLCLLLPACCQSIAFLPFFCQESHGWAFNRTSKLSLTHWHSFSLSTKLVEPTKVWSVEWVLDFFENIFPFTKLFSPWHSTNNSLRFLGFFFCSSSLDCLQRDMHEQIWKHK